MDYTSIIIVIVINIIVLSFVTCYFVSKIKNLTESIESTTCRYWQLAEDMATHVDRIETRITREGEEIHEELEQSLETITAIVEAIQGDATC